MKYIECLTISQKSPQISTTRKCIHFSLLWHGNVQNVPKNRISGHFVPFRPPLAYSEAIYTSNEVLLMAYTLSKFPQISTALKCIHFLILWYGNVQNVPISHILGHFYQFCPPNQLKSHLYYQWSTSNGSYSPKSHHKLVLSVTVFISYF